MAETSAESVAKRKVRQGVVTSSARDKTITVRIDSASSHPMYGKIVRRSSKLHAHDETNTAGIRGVNHSRNRRNVSSEQSVPWNVSTRPP